jgi:hypothetical protein
MNYRVIWMIDIDAKSPHEAAAEALKIQRDPQSTATSFDVLIPPRYPEVEARIVTVDLEEVGDINVN